MKCTRCGAISGPGEAMWDFGDTNLCQMCWEAYCSATYWESEGGVFQTPKADKEFFG